MWIFSEVRNAILGAGSTAMCVGWNYGITDPLNLSISVDSVRSNKEAGLAKVGIGAGECDC